ncbi:MAG: putative toxin-antitoxin system toxin component, PIN family [Spirochaetae bacterium HGW-Spirochaetae-1]|jgi:putative PIN family toxin of toxin-antitoxin system|nr:MAG: putative toxin-antitoxin system toxin component, PIN family [Spirochaetae bacterium HGW-Spirochaetae-1]
MKIVLDSNIIIAAFSTRGMCSAVFELSVEKYEVLISTQILGEVTKNLEKKFKMPDRNIRQIVDYLKEFCILSEYTRIPESVSRDKDDDGIISLAYHNAAKFIVTGDKDLLMIKKYKAVQIVTPREFWETAKKDKSL